MGQATLSCGASTLSGPAMTGHIKLQSSYGNFDSGFRKQLQALEKAMIDQGLDPAAFVISKDAARVPRLPIAFRPTGHPAEYTVHVKDRSFTVAQPNDLSFLDYFYSLCVPPKAKEDDSNSHAHLLHAEEKKLAAFIERLEAWFNKPI
jgi:hypothetical protein